VPFIQKAMKLEEIVSVRDMRSVVKEKFKEYKDVKDQRVSAGCCLQSCACSRLIMSWGSGLGDGVEVEMAEGRRWQAGSSSSTCDPFSVLG